MRLTLASLAAGIAGAVLSIGSIVNLVAAEAAEMELLNQASVDLDVYWRDENSGGTYTRISTILKGTSGVIQTFQGHGFLLTGKGHVVGPLDPPNFLQQMKRHRVRASDSSQEELIFEDLDLGGEIDAPKDGRGKQHNESTGASTSSDVTAQPLEANVQLQISNQAGGVVYIYWLHPERDSFVLLNTMSQGQSFKLNSFVGHRLLISQVPDNHLDHSKAPNIIVHRDSRAFDVVSSNDITADVIVKKHEESASRKTVAAFPREQPPPLVNPPATYHKSVTGQQVKEALKQCGGEASCIVDALYRGKLARIQRSIQKSMTERDELQEPYRDYACLHHETMGPEDMKVTYWTYPEDKFGATDSPSPVSGATPNNKTVRVDHYFDSEWGNARIYLLHDIISPSECAALKNRSSGRLLHASVSGDLPGQRIISSVRKAKSASIAPDLKDPTDILATLQRRVFAFANEHGCGGYESFDLAGQESLNAIVYDASGDEYRMHCDGYCDSSKFVRGGRAATMVLYCEEGVRGGQTSFTNADIVLKGKAGQAAFFHYRGPDDYMDVGYTKHSGCPLVEGNKRITTQWIRRGVSAASPYYLYTPTGDRDTGGAQ
jgi:hypothetical protein